MMGYCRQLRWDRRQTFSVRGGGRGDCPDLQVVEAGEGVHDVVFGCEKVFSTADSGASAT